MKEIYSVNGIDGIHCVPKCVHAHRKCTHTHASQNTSHRLFCACTTSAKHIRIPSLSSQVWQCVHTQFASTWTIFKTIDNTCHGRAPIFSRLKERFTTHDVITHKLRLIVTAYPQILDIYFQLHAISIDWPAFSIFRRSRVPSNSNGK